MAEATESDTLSVATEKNKFQKMREDLNQKFSELTSLVNQRKLKLDRKIDDLEIEYNNKNKQIEKDKQTMKGLREMTEQKIDQNTLMDVQNNIIKEISDKILKLDSESKSQLELTLTLNWNFANIKQEIDRIDLKLAIPNEPHISSPFRADPTDFEANFNPSINYQIPVPYHVSHTLPGSGIRSELSSLNKNSHLLHCTKEAIYDLFSQNPDGIVGENIEEAYFRIFRTKLPYYQLGHRDLKGFIESIPDIVRIDYSNPLTPICHLAHRKEKQAPKRDYNQLKQSLNMGFSKLQRNFVRTQISSIAEMRSEVKLKLSDEPVLRFLEGNNVVLLAGEDQGKCALMSVALTNDLDMLTDNLQSLVICQDSNGAQKIFQCLETLSDNTELKVSCYDSPEKFRSVRAEAHIIVLIHTLLSELFTQYDTTQLTRIGLYNLITDLNTYFEIVRILKLNMRGKLSELKFFFATNPHNEAGTFILKLINTLMVSKCIFSYNGKDRETCLTLLPHDVERNQIQNASDAAIRPRLLASLARTRMFPNLFDKFLIPLGASSNNFTIVSNHIEEELLLQSLALIAMNKVEPSTAMTQVTIVVSNEQQAKDFLELCELGQVAGVKSLMVNGKTIKEEMRYTHICIGWPKEISVMANITTFLSRLSLVILFRVDIEQKFGYLENLFRNCLSPQIVVVGSNYSRQILKFESQFMSEPKHITFLARDTY